MGSCTGRRLLIFPSGRYTLRMKMLQLILMAAVAGVCFSASAQWQWIDKDGRKVFSDRAPPPEILEKNIVKRPAGRSPPATLPSDVADDTTTPPVSAPPTVGKTTGLDKDLETKKKQAQDAEQAKRKADEERVARERIENCVRAKQAKATYESSGPIARINAAGQREIMDEAARAGELKRIQAIMASDCK